MLSDELQKGEHPFQTKMARQFLEKLLVALSCVLIPRKNKIQYIHHIDGKGTVCSHLQLWISKEVVCSLELSTDEILVPQ